MRGMTGKTGIQWTLKIENPFFSPLFLQAKAKAALTVASARGGTDHQEASTGG